jgi:transketolase
LKKLPKKFGEFLSDIKSITIAKNARVSALRMVHSAKASHIGSALSVIDILSVIYSKAINPGESAESDFVLISKGHAASGVYAVLKEYGYLSTIDIDSYCTDGAKLSGHVTSTEIPVVTLSTGSLGHALPVAVGIAIGKKRKNFGGNVYVVMSDGELNEGSNWEGILSAAHFNLDNLIVIIDRNKLQSLRSTEETIRLDSLTSKFLAFNWICEEVDGHNHLELAKSIDNNGGAPKVIIANTIKGKGVSFMENSVQWHYKFPNEEELSKAKAEINNER